MVKPKKRQSPVKRDYIPVTVPFTATPTGETPSISQWAHHTVWTERGLEALLPNRERRYTHRPSGSERLLYRAWVPCSNAAHIRRPTLRNLLNGEPYAGKLPVRLEGRGDQNQLVLPTPTLIHARSLTWHSRREPHPPLNLYGVSVTGTGPMILRAAAANAT